MSHILAWLVKSRRIRCDYEFLPQSARAFVHVAMSRQMVRRLAGGDRVMHFQTRVWRQDCVVLRPLEGHLGRSGQPRKTRV
jgi:hypothetical protein